MKSVKQAHLGLNLQSDGSKHNQSPTGAAIDQKKKCKNN